MKERIYNCVGDNGMGFVSFQFVSCHRANSMLNFRDARRLYRKFHGASIIVICTSLAYYEEGKVYE